MALHGSRGQVEGLTNCDFFLVFPFDPCLKGGSFLMPCADSQTQKRVPLSNLWESRGPFSNLLYMYVGTDHECRRISLPRRAAASVPQKSAITSIATGSPGDYLLGTYVQGHTFNFQSYSRGLLTLVRKPVVVVISGRPKNKKGLFKSLPSRDRIKCRK